MGHGQEASLEEVSFLVCDYREGNHSKWRVPGPAELERGGGRGLGEGLSFSKAHCVGSGRLEIQCLDSKYAVLRIETVDDAALGEPPSGPTLLNELGGAAVGGRGTGGRRGQSLLPARSPGSQRMRAEWSLWGSFRRGWTPAPWNLLHATGREEVLVGTTRVQHLGRGKGRPIWGKAEPEDWGGN